MNCGYENGKCLHLDWLVAFNTNAYVYSVNYGSDSLHLTKIDTLRFTIFVIELFHYESTCISRNYALGCYRIVWYVVEELASYKLMPCLVGVKI